MFKYLSCFISYSSRDTEFAQRLHADLERVGVRCWFSPDDLRTGQKFKQCIDDSIWRHDKLLLVWSAESIRGDWVEAEVEAAFERAQGEPGRAAADKTRRRNQDNAAGLGRSCPTHPGHRDFRGATSDHVPKLPWRGFYATSGPTRNRASTPRPCGECSGIVVVS